MRLLKYSALSDKYIQVNEPAEDLGWTVAKI